MAGERQSVRTLTSASTIDVGAVAKMLKLVNHLHRMPRDPMQRKRELLDGLVAMVAADRGACAVLHDDGGPAPVFLSMALGDKTARRQRSGRSNAAGSNSRKGAPLADALVAAVRRESSRRKEPTSLDVHPEITDVIPLDRTGIYAAVALRRETNRGFARADRIAVETFHCEMAWVYELDLPLAWPAVVALPPRARETLQYLLTGMSEKEVAARLKLSRNTIHHYVKLLYRHFAVTSRSELLSRWLGDWRAARHNESSDFTAFPAPHTVSADGCS